MQSSIITTGLWPYKDQDQDQNNHYPCFIPSFVYSVPISTFPTSDSTSTALMEDAALATSSPGAEVHVQNHSHFDTNPSSASSSSLYGRRDFDLLASNNPSCYYPANRLGAYPPEKNIFPLINGALLAVYENTLHPSILDILAKLNVVAHFKILHPLRMGFEHNGSNNPIVLLFVFEHSVLTVDVANRVVSAVADIVERVWKGECIYIDVCQLPKTDTRSSEPLPDSPGVDLRELYKSVYDDAFPLPGASLGPRDLTGCTGTICGYVTHGSDTYAVTNCHVVNGFQHQVLGPAPYIHKDGDKEYIIESPSSADHQVTIESIRQDVEYGLAEKDTLDKAEGYDRYLGYIKATSGSVPPPTPNDARKDWGLILCRSTSRRLIQNKHRRIEGLKSGYYPVVKERNSLAQHGISKEWVDEAVDHFKQSPAFGSPAEKSFHEREDPYLKPPSARSGFRTGQCNGFRSTLFAGSYGITREVTFICPVPHKTFSEAGDSGSSVLDKAFHIAGMLWGGDLHGGDDLTYVSWFVEVLRDIEKTLGWEVGSCVWLL